jgi:hypothetical protein
LLEERLVLLTTPKPLLDLSPAPVARLRTATWPRSADSRDPAPASLGWSQRLALGRIELLLLLNLVLQAGDGLVTLSGLRLGMSEGNPLIAGLMGVIGMEPGLVLAKLGAILGLLVLYTCRRHPFVEPGLAALAAIYTVFSILPWTLLLTTL